MNSNGKPYPNYSSDMGVYALVKAGLLKTIFSILFFNITLFADQIPEDSVTIKSIETTVNQIISDSGSSKTVTLPKNIALFKKDEMSDCLNSLSTFFVKYKSGCERVSISRDTVDGSYDGTISDIDTLEADTEKYECGHRIITTTNYLFFFSDNEALAQPNGNMGTISCVKKCFTQHFAQGCGSPPDLYDRLSHIDSTGFHFTSGGAFVSLQLSFGSPDSSIVLYGDVVISRHISMPLRLNKKTFGSYSLSRLSMGSTRKFKYKRPTDDTTTVTNSSQLPAMIRRKIGDNRPLPVHTYDTVTSYIQPVNRYFNQFRFVEIDTTGGSYTIYRDSCNCESDSSALFPFKGY